MGMVVVMMMMTILIMSFGSDVVAFPEADVHRIVGDTLQTLLACCRDADETVHDAAHWVVLSYGRA